MNKIILVGNLTRDMELRYTQSGGAVGKSGIAVNKKYKNQNGEQIEEVMFIDFTLWGRSAEVANQYLKKGSQVLIEGELKLEQWTDQNGQKKSKHTVTAQNMKMLGGKSDNQPKQGQYQQQYQAPQQQSYQANQVPTYYENAQGRPTPPPQQPPVVDVDEDTIPFSGG